MLTGPERNSPSWQENTAAGREGMVAEQKAAHHSASVLRKQRVMNACAQVTFFFIYIV